MTEHDPLPPDRPTAPPGPEPDGPTGGGTAAPPDTGTPGGAGPADEPTVVLGASAAEEPTAVGGPAAGGQAAGGPTAASAFGAGEPTGAGGSSRYQPPPYQPSGGPPRRLQRSTRRKVIAGVSGGLGEYTGIDPVLFRVLFAVLTVFGGVGVLLYVVGWLFLPAEDQEVSAAESLIGRGGRGGRGTDIVQAAALVIVGLILAGVVSQGDGGDVLLLVLAVGGVVLLVRNLNERRDGRPLPPPPPPPYPAQPYEQPYQAQPYQAYEQPPFPPAGGAPQTAAFGAAAGSATATLADPEPPAKRVKRRRERSILGVLTLSVLLVVLGVAAAIEGDDPHPRTYLALALGVLGLGLVVGAFRGGARGLVWIGIPVAVALVAVSTADVSLDGGTGDRQYRPQSVAELREGYRIGIGNVRLDLTDLDFTGQNLSVTASAGIGNVEVLVPRNVDVQVDGRSGIGEAALFGENANGTSAERSAFDQGPDGEGGGRLRLVLEVGVGRVEVDRATA